MPVSIKKSKKPGLNRFTEKTVFAYLREERLHRELLEVSLLSETAIAKKPDLKPYRDL
jgi:hypothetical protein